MEVNEKMNRWLHLVFSLCLVAILVSPSVAADKCTKVYGDGSKKVILATGSPGALGLVEALAEQFNKKNGTLICWRKAGSGASLKLLKNKEVDIVMVHAPAAEKKAVKEGWAIKRSLIGSNEFFIVGPKDDPAKIAGAKSAAEAYGKIAKSKAKFLSRGDNSGTHKKEMMIWKLAGVNPEGDWYIITKDFMTPTLKKANADKGYFMTDSSTWVMNKKNLENLAVLFKGDQLLVNTYHAMAAPKGATPGQEMASKFVDFVASDEGQAIVGGYGKKKCGEPLYNDAEYAKKYDH
jgi:tungstate transport system substrate-binding protein